MYRQFPPVASGPREVSSSLQGRRAGVKVTLGSIYGGGGADFYESGVDKESFHTNAGARGGPGVTVKIDHRLHD